MADDNLLTPENIHDYVKRRLGFPTVNVELTPDQINDAVDDTLRSVNHYMFKAEPKVQTECLGSIQIGLGDDALGVLSVKALFPMSENIYTQMNIFELMYRMIYPRLPLGEWYELRMFYSMYQRVRGTEPDWYLDDHNKILWVDCTSGPYDICYIIMHPLSLADFFKGKRAYLQLFLSGVVARAKLTLAQVRGKFSAGVPTPGGTLTTDADALRTQGDNELKAFEDQLRSIGIASGVMFWG